MLDYLWGPAAESVLEAISQRDSEMLHPASGLFRFGASAGNPISLSADTLRSSSIELLGSGFGSASLDQIWQALAEFFNMAVQEPFQFNMKIAPLSDIEALWTSPEQRCAARVPAVIRNEQAGTNQLPQEWVAPITVLVTVGFSLDDGLEPGNR